MRSDFLELACCPACEGELSAVPDELDDSAEIVSGSLTCQRCGRAFRIAKRLPLLFLDDEQWRPNEAEASGWVALHKQLGIYDQTGVDIDYRLPYFPEEPWLGVARHFDVAVELADLRGGEQVLDIGAGRGWAAKHFAARGCRVAAIDIVADDQVGLGRAFALMEQAGVRFHPVIGDNERLPLRTDTFDIVFGAAVLHHSRDLRALLASTARVLRPGGRLIAVNEPCLGVSDDEREVLQRDAAQELTHGIKETRPRFVDYWHALGAAGFDEIEVTPLQARTMTPEQLEAWVATLVDGATVEASLHRSKRRWRAFRAQRSLPRARSRREALIRTALLHTSHDVVICARKNRARAM